MKLKCASYRILLKVFFNKFSIIENFESMQTINDKRKYKFQQLFEMLLLSLDTGLGSFSPLVNGPINDCLFEVVQTLTSRCFSSARLCIGFLYTHSCMQPQIL